MSWLLWAPSIALFGQNDATPDPQAPLIEPASNEGQQAISQFKFPYNLQCDLFAAEPDVANIVAIHRDYQGRLFVCETFRQEKGVEDNRRHGHWMDDELAAQTVQDRIDYIRKHIPDADRAYTANDDRIRMLVDTDGNGKPDSVSVFSDKYNRLEMGTGAGVLSYRGKVYYTCIPDLFELQDNDNDGVADVRKSLHTGFGVRFAFRGHDMHGLIVGPDGRLYFSIGDRGYNVSPTIKDPASGAVFRCELDGSNLEVVATGLRNPQEIAFDDYGNLFTGDNNSDSGDKARWTEIAEGGDSGWRMYYQYQPDRGPFNREKIWHPFSAETPAYIVPPIANFSDGPSGLEYYPGTGFGDNFKGRFFLADFRGDATQSGVRSFRNEPNGAFWKLVDDTQPFWNMLVTDLDFGSDGKLYMSDWVFGWQGENKGRIYTFTDPEQAQSPLVKQVESLLRVGLGQQSTENLKTLIGHVDQRVRQESQFELVKRKDAFTLKGIALDTEQHQLARIHAIFGLGQLGRESARSNRSADISFVEPLLADQDWQIVAATAGVAGDLKIKESSQLAKLLTHDNLRVRYRAALSLAKTGTDEDVAAVVNMLAENADLDPMVRHGGIMALNGIFGRSRTVEASSILKLGEHESRSVRIGACIAMRKLLQSNATGIYKHRQLAAKFVSQRLADSDHGVILAAARTIHDLFVESEMAPLADLINRIDEFTDSDALVRRIISANVRGGKKLNAEALGKFAANEKYDEDRRLDAINALGAWTAPPARDLVLHAWRPLDPNKRNVLDARNAITSNFAVLTSSTAKLTSAAIDAAGNLNLTEIGGELEGVALSDANAEPTRVAALTSLAKIRYPGLAKILETLESKFSSLPPNLAARVVDMVASEDEERGLRLIENVMNRGQQSTKQSALATMGTLKSEASADMMSSFLKRMIANDFPAELRLDVALAAEQRAEKPIQEQLKIYTAAMVQPEEPGSAYLDTLVGGNHDAGSKIFYGKTEVSCVRCHTIDGTGGEVGPVLSGIGLTRDRKYLMESIVHPNKDISEGFAQVKVQTDDGALHVGIVKKETDEYLVLLDADGKEIVLEQDSIEGVKPGQSSMPDDLVKQLTKLEIRDLVEYLSHRKTPTPEKKTDHE